MRSILSAPDGSWYPGKDPERDRFAATVFAARLLLVAAEDGQNLTMLARRLGCSQSFVARCARRLIENGVWSGGRTVAAWLDHGPGHPAFWYDVAVADGSMCRRTTRSGEFQWAPAGSWIRPYEPAESTSGGWRSHPGSGPGSNEAFEVIGSPPPGVGPSRGPAWWLRVMGYPGVRHVDPIRALFPNAEWLGERD